VGRLACRFPFEGSRARAVAEASSPRLGRPLMRLGRTSESCMRRRSELVRFARARRGLAVTDCPPRYFRPAPFPGVSRSRVHPLVSFAPSSEIQSRSRLPARTRRAPPMGFAVLLRGSGAESPLAGGDPPRLRSALSVSRALDGFLLAALRGPVSSRCHVRDFLFRGFPQRSAAPARRRPLPSCRSYRPWRSPR